MNTILNSNDIIIKYINNNISQSYYFHNGFVYLLNNNDFLILKKYVNHYELNNLSFNNLSFNNLLLTDLFVLKNIDIKKIENPSVLNYIINNDDIIPPYINYHIILFNDNIYFILNNYLISIDKSNYGFLCHFYLVFVLNDEQFAKYNNHIKINLTTNIRSHLMLSNFLSTFGLNINIFKYKKLFEYLNTKNISLHYFNQTTILLNNTEYPIYEIDNYKFSFFYTDNDVVLIPPNILMSYYRKYKYSPIYLLIFFLIRTNISTLSINHNLPEYSDINLFTMHYMDDQELLKTKINNYANNIEYYAGLNKSLHYKNLVDIKINCSKSFSKRYIFDKCLKYGENFYIDSSIKTNQIEQLFNEINLSKVNYLDIIYDLKNMVLTINKINIYNFANNGYLNIIPNKSNIFLLNMLAQISKPIDPISKPIDPISEPIDPITEPINRENKSDYGICIHIGNILLFDEIISYLIKLTYDYDLYLTINKAYNDSTNIYNQFVNDKINIIKLLNPNTTILYIDNLGADIYPFLYTYKYIFDAKIDYKYILKLHTKSETIWRKKMYEAVLSIPIKEITTHLEKHGLYGHTYSNYDYLNHYYLVKILNMMCCYFFKNQQMEIFKSDTKIDILQNPKKKIISNIFKFVPGTVFWIKFDILKKYPKIINLIDITKCDFNKDFIYQQYLHAIERLFGVLTYMSGYRLL
jgi:hypothetical protein